VAILDPEDFRGDYEQLAAVMRTSWAVSPDATYLYTAELLADCFRYPGATFALAPAIYDGSELVAFAVGLPRRVLIAGATRQILIATFVTVAAAHKASGYGTAIWGELMHRAAAAGYDGVVTYCADGQTMQRIVERSCDVLEFPHVRAKSFSYLVRAMVPGPADAGDGDGRASAQALVDAAARAGQRRGPGDGRRSLHRVWTESEAEWQLSRLGSVAVTDGDAVLCATVATVDDAARTRYLIVEDILWEPLSQAARGALVTRLLMRATSAGAAYAVVPQLGYADLRPFLAAGFLPAPHIQHANLTLWSDPDALPAADSFYLDVI
jgi:hypothetical protein